MLRKANRAAAVATAAAIALGSVGLSSRASAAPVHQPQAASKSDITEFSAGRRYYNNNGGAVALGAFAAIVGTIAAIAIAEQQRKRWKRHHGYYGGYPGPHYGHPYGRPYGYRPY